MSETKSSAVAELNPFASQTPAARGAIAEALVQREVAEVQAGMMLAKRFPRDQIAAMDRILNACTRPTLAEASMYQYNRGGSDVSGPSIKMAEMLAQNWGNLLCGVAEVARNANGSSECLAYAWDLETGFRDEKRFTVKHWRELKDGGGYPLKSERDIYELIANMGARRKRACLLAVIPGDVVEAAVKQCEVTLHTKAEVTEERIKSLLEKFSVFGVTKEHIEGRIQRRLESLTPALMVSLGKVYNSLKDGMSAPADWFDWDTGKEPAAEPAPGSKVAEINAKVAKAKPAAAKPPATPAPTYAEIAEAINRAASIDDVDAAQAMASELPSEQRKEIADMATARRIEMVAK